MKKSRRKGERCTTQPSNPKKNNTTSGNSIHSIIVTTPDVDSATKLVDRLLGSISFTAVYSFADRTGKVFVDSGGARVGDFDDGFGVPIKPTNLVELRDVIALYPTLELMVFNSNALVAGLFYEKNANGVRFWVRESQLKCPLSELLEGFTARYR